MPTQIPVLRRAARLQLIALFGLVASLAASGPAIAASPTLTTLVNFDGTNGNQPYSGLIADAAGDLFGTTFTGGANTAGSVFEIAKTSTGYASTPTTLVSFNTTNGGELFAGLVADAAGDLFGTTHVGGAKTDGTVFEIARTSTGYASTPTTLVSFNTTNGFEPQGGLIVDAVGNLFGTTVGGGANGDGTVFEIAKTSTGYASTPTVLVSFNGTNGELPSAGLIADAAGNLFGTTVGGGANGDGTVFEIAKTSTGYASTPTVLVSFNGTNGSQPYSSLIADAAGDLFGTTFFGGTTFGRGENGDGTVFEIPKTDGGYASTPTTLVSFNGKNGQNPKSSLVFDAAGDLFGTTQGGGTNDDGVFEDNGTVFEIAKTGGGYASTPTTLVSFNGTNGLNPQSSLVFDGSGTLYGTTTFGGANGDGTVFELSGAGTPLSENPQTSDFNADRHSDILLQNATSGEIWMWEMNGLDVIDAGSPDNPGPSWKVIGAGDFYGSLYSDILAQNTTSGEVWIWEMNGNKVVGKGSPGNLGPSWHVIGTGDFNGDGYSDILFQNATSGEIWIWEMNGLKVISSGSPDNPGPSWKVIGTGDFNGDGYSDILAQNTTSGEVWIWEMNGLKVIGKGSPGNLGPNWHVIGTGDFNGDGYSDILFQNATSGEIWIWEMDGLKVIASGSPDSPGPSWRVVGTGDFNGDGYSDILAQNTSGEVWIWELNGLKVIGKGSPGNLGPSWQVIGE